MKELLLEIGCEEIPASWLPSLTRQLGEKLGARLDEARLARQFAPPDLQHAATSRGATSGCGRAAGRPRGNRHRAVGERRLRCQRTADAGGAGVRSQAGGARRSVDDGRNR